MTLGSKGKLNAYIRLTSLTNFTYSCSTEELYSRNAEKEDFRKKRESLGTAFRAGELAFGLEQVECIGGTLRFVDTGSPVLSRNEGCTIRGE